MDTDRAEYLEICQTCINSNFDRKKGLVCSLTSEHASFDLNSGCADYSPEQKAIKRQEANVRRKSDAYENSKGVLSSKVGVIGGIVLIVLAVVWVIVGLALMNRFFFYPIFLAVAGIIAINKGSERKTVVKRSDDDLLDDEII